MTMEGRVDAVTAAVSSLGSCTATTSLTLKQLLSAVPLDEATTTKNASRDPRKPARGGQAKANSKTPRPKPVASDVSTPAQLSTKAQADLAVHVFNTGLKTLSEAVKSGMHVPDDGRSGSSQDSSTPPTSSPAKKSSLALSPRKPQALNRQQPLSPAGKQQNRRPATEKGPTTQSMPLLALVDCMRTSSAALARFDAAGDLRLGRLQLEKGMSSFVAKLIALGLLVQAREELKTLKARLECLRNPLAAKTSRGPTQNIDYAAILDFDHVLPLSDDALALAIASQMHCLRILAKDSGRPSRVSCILPILRPTSDSSPLRLILRLAAESTASSARAAKHLHELCDILISLAPGTSRATDAVASDPAVSARPHVAMELQALGLRARAHALRLLGKENALASDILDPLAKCLRAFARRNTSNDGTAYDLAVRMYEDILRIFGISDAAGCPPTSQSLYLAFAALAEQGRRTGDARQWLQRVQATLDSQSDAVRQFSVSAQLLRLDLKASDSLLANQVLERMKGPLRGSMQDVDELLGSVSTLIKDIYGCLVDQGNNGKPTLKSTLPDDTQQLLKSIVFQGPRFSARWLGKAPGPDSGDKDGQRWQERKQTLMGSMHQTIRAVLTLLSLSLRRPGMSLNDLDGVLQDCMALLTLVGEAVAPNGRSYYVTISGLYFAFCRQSCQKPSSLDADELRALRKSVECLGTRPVQDKDAGDFVWKSEVLAEAYRAAGRTADVARCLRSVLSYMDERGVLQEIVSCLDSQPPSLVWAATEDRKAASRTVQNVAKIGGDILAVTESLPEPQRLAVLERGLSFCIDQARTKDKGIPEDLVKALLQGYVPSRYPIRRLRVLLYSLPSLCQKAGALALYTEDVRATMASIDADTLGDDTGLRPYIRHFKALIESISEFLTASGESVATSKSVAVWDSMLNSEADLYTHVDDPHFLLSYLRSLADYLATVGKSSHVVEILELASRLAKKLDTQDSDTTAVDLALATELLAAGKFERSEQLLVGAENRVEQDPTDAGNPARLNLRLTQAECSLVSRDLDNA